MNAPAKTEDFVAPGAENKPAGIPDNVYAETVLAVEHYTDFLFRFRMTRPAGFRFRSGEFAMIGLMVGDKPIYRAYSIASPAWDEELEFFSIKVPDGPLTSHLQKIRHAGARRADAGQAALHVLDRHRHRAVCEPDPRSGDL